MLRRVLEMLKTGVNGVSYEDIYQHLLQEDTYLLLADFPAYCAAEQRMVQTYGQSDVWNRMSLHNIARSGIFAADRAVAEYAEQIWHVPYKK